MKISVSFSKKDVVEHKKQTTLIKKDKHFCQCNQNLVFCRAIFPDHGHGEVRFKHYTGKLSV